MRAAPVQIALQGETQEGLAERAWRFDGDFARWFKYRTEDSFTAIHGLFAAAGKLRHRHHPDLTREQFRNLAGAYYDQAAHRDDDEGGH